MFFLKKRGFIPQKMTTFAGYLNYLDSKKNEKFHFIYTYWRGISSNDAYCHIL